MSWFHSFLFVFGVVLLVSGQPADSTTEDGATVENRRDSSDPLSSLGVCDCCKNEEVWEGIAYSKTLIMWLRSKMADAGSEAAYYQKLNYLKSFDYKYMMYKSKQDPEAEIDWSW